MLEVIYKTIGFIRRPFWKLRRFWRRIYYGFTDALMILGGSVLLAAVWYFMFVY